MKIKSLLVVLIILVSIILVFIVIQQINSRKMKKDLSVVYQRVESKTNTE